MVNINNWRLGRIGDEIVALNAGVSVNSDANDNGSNFYILKTSAVSKGKVNLEEIKPVVSNDICRLKCSLKANSILISRMNTPELVGECGYVEKDNEAVFLPDRIWQTVLRQESKLNCKWLTYVLNTDGLRQYIKNAATGTSNSMKNISKDQILNIEILFPEPEEQTVIAEALSNADSLIASLEKLIEKKKAIKQGAMQELLTGKKRLPGFSGIWKEISIGNESYTQVDYENLTSSTLPDYTFEYITLENVNNGNLLETITCQYATAPSRARRIIHKNDILFGTVRPNLHSHLHINYECKNVVCSTGFCVIGCYTNVLNAKFLYFKLFTAEIDRQVEAIISGSNYPALSNSDVKSLKITIPPSIKEQTAIAAILSDMDYEIEQLEKKLAKYHLIKRGMMQALLTGRIRLIEPTVRAETVAKHKVVPACHNQYYDDAIAISAIVNTFYHDKFPLGRVKVQKLLYLLRRKQHADVSAFKKKAAGPYNEAARYKGGEAIAFKNEYIVRQSSDKGAQFGRGANIDEVLKYVGSMQSNIDWLYEKFKYYNTYKEKNNLEVLATVDMAVWELDKSGRAVSLESVKEVICSNKEWAPKLKKDCFMDEAISQAIVESRELFG